MQNKKFKDLLPYIFLCLVYILNVFMIFKYSSTYLNSDMASEMVLAKLMNDHKDIFFCKEWCYSTEIRFIYLQVFFRLGLLIFPNNWIYARTFGSALALLALTLSFLHLTKTLKLDKYGVWMTGLLLCPISTIYFMIVGFGNSYVPHLICYILITDLLIMYIRNHKPVYLVLLILLGISGGLNGIRILFSYLLPLITITLLVIYAFNKDLSVKEYIKILFKEYYAVLIECVSILLGFIINNFYLSKIYVYRNYLGHTLSDLSINTIVERISDYLRIFGFASGNKILSIGTFSSVFCVIFDFILIYVLFNSIKNYKKIIETNDKITFIFTIGLLVSILEFGLVFNVMDETQINYWIPLVPFTFVCIGLYLKNSNNKLKDFLLIMTVISIIGSSIYPLAVVKNTKYDNSKMEVVDYLLENNLHEGYGSFWSGNVLKELSNGQIDIWTTGDYLEYNNDYNVYSWLQETSHLSYEPKGRSFLIIDLSRDEIDTSTIKEYKTYENYNYEIYLFDKFDEIKNYMNTRYVD